METLKVKLESKRRSKILPVRGKLRLGTTSTGKTSLWGNFVTPSILVQGYQTLEGKISLHPQPLVPCGQSVVCNFGRSKF